jgi:hypothetical protein
MKRAVAAIFVASCAFAGDKSVIARASGPEAVIFNADQPQVAPRKPEAEKALVYVIQERRLFVGNCIKCNPTVRVGVDGNWMGALYHHSWLSFSLQPGDPHLCADLQAAQRGQAAEPKEISLTGFTAEPSTVYYFRVRATNDQLGWITVTLEATNRDQGEPLVTSYPPSLSQPKK